MKKLFTFIKRFFEVIAYNGEAGEELLKMEEMKRVEVETEKFSNGNCPFCGLDNDSHDYCDYKREPVA